MKTKEAVKMNLQRHFYKVVSMDRTAKVESTSMEKAAAQFMKVPVRKICGCDRTPRFATFNVLDNAGNETSDYPIAVFKI